MVQVPLSIFIYDCWTLQQGEKMKLLQKLHQLCSKGQAERPATTVGCAAIPSGNSVPSLHLYCQAPELHAVKSEVSKVKKHDVPRCCICRTKNKSFPVWYFSNFHSFLLVLSFGRHFPWKILVEHLMNYNKFWLNGSSHNWKKVSCWRGRTLSQTKNTSYGVQEDGMKLFQGFHKKASSSGIFLLLCSQFMFL